ncbi:hypothetical protein [Streptomyces malaysiensis]|uniref:hypothetical protein n=1 Tax=Streptomyces malaysiensis TaxID=92644 RepID=UPI0018D537B5|nr:MULTISPECIES: hypothetical protein [unclassified Streptomyces]
MTAAIITASASIVVAVLAFLLSQHSRIRQERRQARLARVNGQLRDLYGPLNTLVDTNGQIWEALRATTFPARDERNPESGTSEWLRWRDQVLMPTNRRIRYLIIEHADLIIETETPKPLLDFCAHVLSVEVAITEEAEGVNRRALIAHPGDDFISYVHDSFIRHQQQRLLGSIT